MNFKFKLALKTLLTDVVKKIISFQWKTTKLTDSFSNMGQLILSLFSKVNSNPSQEGFFVLKKA